MELKANSVERAKGLSAFGAEAHSSGELKFSSSQPTLSYRVGPKSEAITPFNSLTPQTIGLYLLNINLYLLRKCTLNCLSEY